MAKEFLSQDEVDSLLKDVPGDADAAPAPEDGVRCYGLGREGRAVRGALPALEAINERFVRQVRPALAALVRGNPVLSASAIRIRTFGEFAQELAAPANINVVRLKPLRGNALIVFDANLILAVVDGLFGGNGRLPAPHEEREFTLTEMRIIQRLLAIVMESHQQAWAPVFALGLEYLRSETHARRASIAAAEEMVVGLSYPLEIGAARGQLRICIPYAALEPVRELLAGTPQGDQRGPDQRWLPMLTQRMQLAEVELKANLATVPLRISQLLGMKVGDVIGFDPPDLVSAEVDGIPIFECRYGVLNRRYAIKVERVLAAAGSDGNQGGARAA
jgi:flagellar motor switch protein FliM